MWAFFWPGLIYEHYCWSVDFETNYVMALGLVFLKDALSLHAMYYIAGYHNNPSDIFCHICAFNCGFY